MKATILSASAIFLVVMMGLSAAGAQNQISFWTTEDEEARMKIQRDIALEFTQKTGIEVKVIPVKENRLPEKVTAAFAAKSLPDVIFHPMEFTIGWAEEGVLDAESAAQVVKELGKETFGSGPLNLVKVAKGYAALPLDGWGQLLLYRKDLFKENNLPVPDRWDRILQAAETLHKPPLLWGFEAATDPGQTYTQQVFEHFALSNGVRLVGTSGNIELNTSEMVQTLEFYKDLVRFTPPGNLYWMHTRLDYLSGRAAMIIWSPFILDELAGLRKDQPVVADLRKGEPGFLVKNTGIVPIINGPKGAAQYGQINYLGITRDANKDLAKKWVTFVLSDGYVKWLSMAPEGKLPLRKGTRDKPGRFIEEWKELEFGATTRARISKYYGMETIKTIVSGVEGFDRWGFARGKGALITKIYGTKVIPRVLKRYLDGEMGSEQAAQMIDKQIKALN